MRSFASCAAVAVGVAWVIAAALCVSVAGALPPLSQVEAAFAADGFEIAQRASYGPYRGLRGASKTATILANGNGKPMLFVEGNATSFGYLTGVLASSEVEQMTTTFLDRLPIELVAATFAREHWNETVYDELEKVVAALLGDISVKLFHQSIDRGTIPKDRLVEMEAIVDGVAAGRALRGLSSPSPVTLERLISINFAFDMITARVFSGHFLGRELQGLARSLGLPVLSSPAFYAELAAMGAQPRDLFREPAFCDAVGFRKSFTASGSGAFFGRSYQMVTGNVIQNLITLIVYVPDDEAKTAMVTATAPGMVGAFAGMNAAGLAMGVDTIRAPNSNPEDIGLNSLLLIRSTLESSHDLASGVDYVVDAHRGAAFLYPMCDATGDCAVLESGAWTPAGTPDDPLQYVEHKLVDDGLVPDAKFLAAHPLPEGLYRHGLFVRASNYTDTELMAPFLGYNKGLYAAVGLTYNASVFEPGNLVFPTWEADLAAEHTLRNNFFVPQMEQDPDFITLSNFAVNPYGRMNMMSSIDNLVAPSGESMYWRYSQLVKLSTERKGTVDLDVTQWIMEFLSPERAPGYWKNRLWKDQPASTIVEGSLTIYDLGARIIRSKSGYWGDKWIELHLNAYL